MIALATAGLIRHDGDAANRQRPSRKRGLVRLWRLADTDAAEQTTKHLRSLIRKKSSAGVTTEQKQLTLFSGVKDNGKAN